MSDSPSFAEDPSLSPSEKEVNIRVDKQSQRLAVHSEIASVTRALYHRDDFEETGRRVVDGDVVSIRGKLPMGVLKVQKNAREYGSFASIVSDGDSDGE